MKRASVWGLIAAWTLGAGCAEPGEIADRQPLGKADIFGSCEGTDCSGPSDGNCYCDDACVEIGDCCADKVEVCDLDVVSLGNGLSGHCLDVDQNSLIDLAPLIGWYCHGQDNQRWQIVPLGDGFVNLVAVHSAKCLDVKAASQEPGAPLIQFSCHGGPNQAFALQPSGDGIQLVAKHSGMCVDLPLSTPATGVVQWECQGGKNQRWHKILP